MFDSDPPWQALIETIDLYQWEPLSALIGTFNSLIFLALIVTNG